jgi:hypothetical protein
MGESSSPQQAAAAGKARRFNRQSDCASRPLADLAGRSVKLSIDVPALFDAPLAKHHKLIGRWVAARETTARRYTRPQARARIEKVFGAAVLEILNPFELADLRVVVLHGDENLPPALAVICDSVGQLDLGWIEADDNVLRNTAFRRVAPVSWRAAAYKALVDTLSMALPIFGYEDLFEEMSGYYWDGETDDLGATKAMIEWHGTDPAEIDEEMLPSAMNARRPEWMLAKNAAPMKQLPAPLRQNIRKLRDLHKALAGIATEANAWRFAFDQIVEYIPDFEDASHLPAMTLVPADHFARELDYVGEHGMQQGFMDVAGLCPLPDASQIDDWFASLKLGAELLLAAQDLINLNPASM